MLAPSDASEERELASKLHSHRLLNFDQASVEQVTLSKRLNEIRFPQKIPNSPYSINQFMPATPISLAMELKNWLQESLRKVNLEPNGCSKVVMDVIRKANDEKIVDEINKIIEESVKSILEELAKK